MDNRYTAVRAMLIGFCFVHILQVYGQRQASDYGNFPYYQGFRSTVQPSEIERATVANGSNAVTFTTEGMRLTPAQKQQFGGVFVKDRRFRATQGIRIEFEYAIYGGTGADGMSAFLFDASVANPAIGATGAGLGYGYNRSNDRYPELRTPGLSGAYLGIALDSYGNFKQRRWYGDSRVNGISGLETSKDNRYISNVTLRGAEGASLPIEGMGKGYTGYPVLISQPTLERNRGWKLNESGGYTDMATYQGDFDLRGGLSSYRKAIIEFFPASDSGTGGFLVTVSIQHGQALTTVINDYQYKTSLVYTENAHTANGDYNRYSPDTLSLVNTTHTLNAAIPEFFRIGFAASTGGETDIHLLRELKITLPGAAEAYDDYGTTRRARPVALDVLGNDIGYTGVITKGQQGSHVNLDPSTFRFCDQAGNFLGTTASGETSYATKEGSWVFDFTLGKLAFTPSGGFIGQASVRYSIKAGLNNEMPYNDEAYRSLPATVTVDVTPAKTVISNRMATSVIAR